MGTNASRLLCIVFVGVFTFESHCVKFYISKRADYAHLAQGGAYEPKGRFI